MNIHIRMNDARLMRRSQTGGPVDFIIYIEQDGAVYPDEVWYDFGAVILAWWLAAAEALAGGGISATFRFMEGPYALDLTRHVTSPWVSMRLQGRDYEWHVTLDQVIPPLIRAAEEVIRKLDQLNVGASERSALESSLAALKKVWRPRDMP